MGGLEVGLEVEVVGRDEAVPRRCEEDRASTHGCIPPQGRDGIVGSIGELEDAALNRLALARHDWHRKKKWLKQNR